MSQATTGASIFSRMTRKSSPGAHPDRTSSLRNMEDAPTMDDSRRASVQKGSRQNSTDQTTLAKAHAGSSPNLKEAKKSNSPTGSAGSAPVGSTVGQPTSPPNRVAMLRNRYESMSNRGSPALPVLTAVENGTEAGTNGSSGEGDGSNQSKRSVKKAKRSKAKEKTKQNPNANSGKPSPPPAEPGKDVFIDSKNRVRRSSVRPASSSLNGRGLNEDDLKSLTLDTDDVPQPLTRKSSTLSTRQQAALRKTPSFLARTHTPPPDQLRELKRRQKQQNSELGNSGRTSRNSSTDLGSTASSLQPVTTGKDASFKFTSPGPAKGPPTTTAKKTTASSPGETAKLKPSPPVAKTPAKVCVKKMPPPAKMGGSTPADYAASPKKAASPKSIPMFSPPMNVVTPSSKSISQKEKSAKSKEAELMEEPPVVYSSRGRNGSSGAVVKEPPRRPSDQSSTASSPKSGKKASLSLDPIPASPTTLQTFNEMSPTNKPTPASRKPVTASPKAKAPPGKPSTNTTNTTPTATTPETAKDDSRFSQANRRTVSSYLEDDDDLYEIAPSPGKAFPLVGEMEKDDDDDDDEELDEEGLLEGFRPEGYDAKRGRRTRSSVVFYLTEEDSFSSTDEMVGDSALFRRDYMSFSALDHSAGTAQPIPKITLDEYRPPKPDEYVLRPPSFKNRIGHPYGTTSVAASAKSVLSSLAYDPYGINNLNSSLSSGLMSSTTNREGSAGGRGSKMVLPKPPKSVYCGRSAKYAPDPAKIHRPIANTFGGPHLMDALDDEDEEDEEEWYWEEVEDEEEEEPTAG